MELKGNWNEWKGKLKKEYGDVTDDELKYEEGKTRSCGENCRKDPGKSKNNLVNWLKNPG